MVAAAVTKICIRFMNTLSLRIFTLTYRLRFFALTLTLLLQRSPFVRFLSIFEASVRTPVTRLFQLVASAAVFAETQHALTGATTFSTNPTSPASATTGEAFDMVFAVTGAPSAVASWRVQGTIPPGLTIAGLVGDTLNSRVGTISGTPTQAGDYEITLKPYEKTNLRGETTKFSYSIHISVAGGVTTPPETTFILSTSNNAATVGEPFVVDFSIQGMSAASWEITGSLAPGLSLNGLNQESPVNGVLNSISGSISGIPTEAGDYTINLQPYEEANLGGVTDGIKHSITISVSNPVLTTSYDRWRFEHFSNISEPSNGDPDNDTIPNLLEYALGLDPNLPDREEGISSQFSWVGKKPQLMLRFNRYATPDDANLLLEYADSAMGPWNTLASSNKGAAFAGSQSLAVQSSANEISVILDDTFFGSDPGFFRLQASQ